MAPRCRGRGGRLYTNLKRLQPNTTSPHTMPTLTPSRPTIVAPSRLWLACGRSKGPIARAPEGTGPRAGPRSNGVTMRRLGGAVIGSVYRGGGSGEFVAGSAKPERPLLSLGGLRPRSSLTWFRATRLRARSASRTSGSNDRQVWRGGSASAHPLAQRWRSGGERMKWV